MAAYIIVRVSVNDWEKYRKYMELTPTIVSRYEGKFLSRGGDRITLEGPEETSRIVLLEFPTLEKAREFYLSQDYSNARKLREGAADAQFVAVSGVA